MRNLRALLAMICAVLIVESPILADSWVPASIAIYHSPNHEHRVIVEPREISSSLAYFKDAVDGKESPGQSRNGNQKAQAMLQSRDTDGRWENIWQGSLLNDIAPVNISVSNDGKYFVTFDNWYSLGYGDDALVIYRNDGKIVKQFAVTDIVPSEYFEQLPASVSSRSWRKDDRIKGDKLEIDLVTPRSWTEEMEGTKNPTIPITIDLSDGSITGTDTTAFDDALRKAKTIKIKEDQARKAIIAAESEALLAPSNNDQQEWKEFLEEAYARLGGENEYPQGHYIRPDMWEDEIDYYHDIFVEDLWDAVIVAAASPKKLRRIVETIALKASANSQSKREFIFFTDSPTTSDFPELLKKSGATVKIYDPSKPIPQRLDRIRGTPEWQERMRLRAEKERIEMDEIMRELSEDDISDDSSISAAAAAEAAAEASNEDER